jgi:hypothetical protein
MRFGGSTTHDAFTLSKGETRISARFLRVSRAHPREPGIVAHFMGETEIGGVYMKPGSVDGYCVVSSPGRSGYSVDTSV